MTTDKRDEKRDRAAEEFSSFCYCAGQVCSGCEQNTQEIFKAGWDACSKENDAGIDKHIRKAQLEIGKKVLIEQERDQWKQQAQALAEALQSMLAEAQLHLGMYIRSYKREPYDTGILLDLYLHESHQRINIAKIAFEEFKKGL